MTISICGLTRIQWRYIPGQRLLCVDRLVNTVTSGNGATNPRADSESNTERNAQDDDEDNTRDDTLGLLAQFSPWSAAGALTLGNLSLHLQVVSSGPCWINARLGLVLEEVGLALAGLSLLLGQGLSLEIVFERGVADVDVHLGVGASFVVGVVLIR